MNTNENENLKMTEHTKQQHHHSHRKHRKSSSYHSSSSYHKSSGEHGYDPTSEMERKGESLVYKEVYKKKILDMVKRCVFVFLFFVSLIIVVYCMLNSDEQSNRFFKKNENKNNTQYYELEKKNWNLEMYVNSLEEHIRKLESDYVEKTGEEIKPFEFKEIND